MGTELATAAGFDYGSVAAADRQWLREQTGAVRHIARRSAEDVLALGRVLQGVRDRIGRGRWRAWLEAEFAWDRGTAWRFCRVAAEFAGEALKISTFDPSALYVLAQPGTPREARALALQHAADGRRVTHALAREILAACRTPPDLPRAALKAAEAGRRKLEAAAGETHAPPPPPPDPGRAALAALVAACRSVRIAAHADPETGEAEYTVTAHPLDDGGPIRVAAGDDLFEAIVAAAGREPKKVCSGRACPHAGRPQPLFSGFSRNRTRADGRSGACRACERGRLTRFKAKKKTDAAAGGQS